VPADPQSDPQSILAVTAHRPWPLPTRPWRLRQRWNDLLFAHWPIPPIDIQKLLPPGLELDTFDGHAWVGVIPFWMDNVVTRSIADRTFAIPTTRTFPELNLRTYVRSSRTGRGGVYFFSLDCASPLAVLGARTIFHLPYFPAKMTRTTTPSGLTHYTSQRQLTRNPVRYQATYAPSREASNTPRSGARPALGRTCLSSFLTERYCLFTHSRGRILVGEIHHRPWPLEPAEADIRLNEIPAAHGITLPDTAPILHFSRQLEVILWSLRTDTANDSSYG
jgi:uncharacterized protein YqjF (DUF2071 family)